MFYFHPENWGFMIQFELRIFFRWVGEKPSTIEKRGSQESGIRMQNTFHFGSFFRVKHFCRFYNILLKNSISQKLCRKNAFSKTNESHDVNDDNNIDNFDR